MANNTDTKNKKEKNATKYGEFVPSYFEWLTLEEQKKRADKLNEITKAK